MKRMVGALLVATLLGFAVVPLFAQVGSVYWDIGQSDAIPVPRILQPYLDTYDLTGKNVLEFKWSPHEGSPTQRDHYDFRLYKGFTVLESTRICVMRVNPRQWSVALNADMFQDGQVYTCTLRQVYTGSLKSRRAYQSFKIIKKPIKADRDRTQ